MLPVKECIGQQLKGMEHCALFVRCVYTMAKTLWWGNLSLDKLKINVDANMATLFARQVLWGASFLANLTTGELQLKGIFYFEINI